MQKIDFQDAVDAVVAADPSYAADAYGFLQGVLADAVKAQRKSTGGEDRHVCGPELLEAFRRRALCDFGPMAKTVFDEWGVERCEDVGEMVFKLIEAGAFGKSERDQREDFAGGYDFHEAFVVPFLPPAKRTVTSDGGAAARRNK
jgi:uncharacterized repeat protein (TIGR04138 family)